MSKWWMEATVSMVLVFTKSIAVRSQIENSDVKTNSPERDLEAHATNKPQVVIYIVFTVQHNFTTTSNLQESHQVEAFDRSLISRHAWQQGMSTVRWPPDLIYML